MTEKEIKERIAEAKAKEKNKRTKKGGRKKGTPNKITKDFKIFLVEYYFTKSADEWTRFEKIQIALYKLATEEKDKAIRLKAIDMILKMLGIYNNQKLEIGITDEEKDRIKISIGFKEDAENK